MTPISGFFDVLSAPTEDGTLELFHRSSGWSELWRGVRDGQWRIFKCLREEFRGDFRYQTLLRKEYEITRSLEHPGIRRCFGMPELPVLGPCIELEYVNGKDLETLLSEGGLTQKERKRIAQELCDAVEYLHRHQIVHRDLKPANILISRDGGHVKLIDFGLADSDAWAIHKERAGTAGYAAPELTAPDETGGAEPDCRADIFSLGVILSELGVLPKKFTARCCAPRPEERYADMQELRTALTREKRLQTIRRAGGPLLGLLLLWGAFTGGHRLSERFPAPWEGLTFEAAERGTLVLGNPMGLPVEYSRDGRIWTESSTEKIVLHIRKGRKLFFRGDNKRYAIQASPRRTSRKDFTYTNFRVSGRTYVYGNLMSLIRSHGFESLDSLTANDTFVGLLADNPLLCFHPDRPLLLPATTLTTSCYLDMFSETGIEWGPELPATAMAINCYARMFSNCHSLTRAPRLPATEIEKGCYRAMFMDCDRLETAPELPASQLQAACYSSMFNGCSRLKTPPALPADSMVNSCYRYMFYQCTALETAPELPATELKPGCYAHMFQDCASLKSAPILPAKTLADSCYLAMFSGCAALSEITLLATGIPSENCLKQWTKNTARQGTFFCPDGLRLPRGNNGVPDGWTRLPVRLLLWTPEQGR